MISKQLGEKKEVNKVGNNEGFGGVFQSCISHIHHSLHIHVSALKDPLVLKHRDAHITV